MNISNTYYTEQKKTDQQPRVSSTKEKFKISQLFLESTEEYLRWRELFLSKLSFSLYRISYNALSMFWTSIYKMWDPQDVLKSKAFAKDIRFQ